MYAWINKSSKSREAFMSKRTNYLDDTISYSLNSIEDASVGLETKTGLALESPIKLIFEESLINKRCKPSYEVISGINKDKPDFVTVKKNIRKESEACTKHLAHHVEIADHLFQSKYLTPLVKAATVLETDFHVRITQRSLQPFILYQIHSALLQRSGLEVEGYVIMRTEYNKDVFRHMNGQYLYDINVIIHKEGKQNGKLVRVQALYSHKDAKDTPVIVFIKAQILTDVQEDIIQLARQLLKTVT